MYWETYLFHQINTQTVISLKYKAKTRQNGIDIIRNIDQNVRLIEQLMTGIGPFIRSFHTTVIPPPVLQAFHTAA